jgi:uncharacterized membrane protein
MLFTTLLFIGMVVTIQMLGQVCLKRGMNELPLMEVSHFRDVVKFARRVLTNRFVRIALCLWATWYLLYMTVLNRFDISKSYPLNSIDLLLILLVSKFYLREIIPWPRWAGAVLIAAGVYLVASS